MTPPLETQRLFLKPLSLADAPQIQALFPHWEIVRYLAPVVPWPYPPDGAYRFIHDQALPAVERGEAWHWTLRRKSDPENLIGGISLMKRKEGNRGFWVSLPWQQQGFMTEATETVTDFWFDVLGFPSMNVIKAVANVASHRITEKNGMRLVAVVERDSVSGRLPTEIWEITAEEWRSHRRAAR
jgi:ribosomal-protein-alanine N-acetyltransferase